MRPYLVDEDLVKNILIKPPPMPPPPILNKSIKSDLKKKNFDIKISITTMQIFLLLMLSIGLLILYERYKKKKTNNFDVKNKIENLNNIVNKYNNFNGRIFK